MKVRTFIALGLPASLRQELSRGTNLIAGQDKWLRIRWISPGKYHLTLTFLGDVDCARLSELKFVLERKLEVTQMLPCKIPAITPFLLHNLPKLLPLKWSPLVKF